MPPACVLSPYVRTPHNDYWKLGTRAQAAVSDLRAFLTQHGYRFRKRPKKKVVLMQHVPRCQQGLLSYEIYPTEELRSFCEARRISDGQRLQQMSHAKLVTALEEADEHPLFRKFLDLPPELREYVYTLHARYLGQNLDRDPFLRDTIVEQESYRQSRYAYPYRKDDYGYLPPATHQPPLLLASRQLRVEALPVFYSKAAFKLNFSYVRGRASRPPGEVVAYIQGPPLGRMPDVQFARITSFKIFAAYEVLEGLGRQIVRKALLECELDLRHMRESGRPSGLHDVSLKLSWRAVGHADKEAVPVSLRGIVDDVLARSKALALRKDDCKAILAGLQKDMEKLLP